MLWHIMKLYMGFVIAVFFKRIQTKNKHYLNVKGPVIIAMNHPNAFMDPIAFTTQVIPPRVYYLARGDAFKKGIVTALLESLGIIPIFRMQDAGKEGLKKNDETYNRVNRLLKRNKKIIIFAEGLCIQERRLRPLKKGVPRMVFSSMEENHLDDLIVIPVGLNYTNPSQFRSTLFCNIGEPIKIADYMPAYRETPAKTMNQFLADLAPRMKELIVNIDQPKSEKVIENLEEICRYDYFKKHNLNLNRTENDFIFSSDIASVINKAEISNEQKVRTLEEKSSGYLNLLKQHKLRSWLFAPQKQYLINYPVFVLRCLFILATLPLYIRGLIGNYLPYKLTDMITAKKVKLVEFKASFNMGIGAVMFLLYYILQFIVAYIIAPHVWWALLFILVSALTGWFSLFISPFRKKTWGIYRILKLKSSNPALYNKLFEQKKAIIHDLELLRAE